MPRLRPAPTRPPIVEPEDHTPPAEAIEIELAEDEGGEVHVDLATPPSSEPAIVPAEPPAPVVEENPLQKALEAQARAEELQRSAQRERDEAVRQARERDEELVRERTDRQDAEYNSVLTAIAAEQGTVAKAESDYAAAASASDWTTAAAAQRIMASASARLDRLEDGKQAFETKREAAKTEPPAPRPAPQNAPLDFEAKLSAVPGLPDNAKSWLRKHPEFINDTAMNKKVNAAHGYLVDVKAVSPFSDAYFDALDDQFGFKAQPAAPAAPQPSRRSIPMSPPVSRDVPTSSGERAKPKMTLTPEERQIARTSYTAPDMTNEQKEYQYAKSKQKLHAMRANGSYRPTTEQNG